MCDLIYPKQMCIEVSPGPDYTFSGIHTDKLTNSDNKMPTNKTRGKNNKHQNKIYVKEK